MRDLIHSFEKRLFGKPVDDPEVQNFIGQHMKVLLSHLRGEEAVYSLSEKVEDVEGFYENGIIRWLDILVMRKCIERI